MNRVLALIFIAFFLASCDYGVEWTDGEYEVIWVDTANNRTLARIIDKGSSIGRVDAEVVEIGSNAKFIVAKQKLLGSNEVCYFIVDKEKDSKYLNSDEITEGPLTEAAFIKEKKERGLPNFTVAFGNG